MPSQTQLSALASIAALAGLAALAACSSQTPQIPDAGTPSARASSAQTPADKDWTRCTGPSQRLPGDYPLIQSLDGNVKGTTFTTGNDGQSTWYLEHFTKGTGFPAATRPPSPDLGHGKTQKLYYYYGTYSLHKYGNGCMILGTTVNGRAYYGVTGNSKLLAQPKISGANPPNYNQVSVGPVSITVKHLSPHGGHGSIVLSTTSGKVLDKGSVTLTSRQTVVVSTSDVSKP
jgi:hypothetical protein